MKALDESLANYVNEVMHFSKAMSLTGIKHKEEFWGLFIQPSLALLEWLPSRGCLMDVGSGMGIPGVPILLARPSLKGILVERRKKRAEFLRHIRRALHLNYEVYDVDVRQLKPLSVDACVARAVASPRDMLGLCRPHMNDGGVALIPVSRGGRQISASDWLFIKEVEVQAGKEKQLIHCYRYEEVSRET